MDITAVTSIGGKGTRIESNSKGLPKGLLDINGKSVIYRIAEQVSYLLFHYRYLFLINRFLLNI